MRSLGLEEADAYVMDGWDDARIAQILNAENNHRKELAEAERGRGIRTMLSLGAPVADAAVSADIPEGRAESYVRGTKVVPADAVNLGFEVVALMGDYDDALAEDDVVAVLSKKSFWGRQAVCRKARARAAAEVEAARLESLGVKVAPRRGLPRMRRRVRAPRPRGRREAPGLGRGRGRHLLLRRRVPRLPAHSRGDRGDGGLPRAKGDA